MKTLEQLEEAGNQWIATRHGNYLYVRKLVKNLGFSYEFMTLDNVTVDLTREQAQDIVNNYQLKDR